MYAHTQILVGSLLALASMTAMAVPSPATYHFTDGDMQSSEMLYQLPDGAASSFSGFLPDGHGNYEFSIGLNFAPAALLVGQKFEQSMDLSSYDSMRLRFTNTSDFQLASVLYAVSRSDNSLERYDLYAGAVHVLGTGASADLFLDFSNVAYGFALNGELFSDTMVYQQTFNRNSASSILAVSDLDNIYSYGIAIGIGRWGSQTPARVTGIASVPEPGMYLLMLAGMIPLLGVSLGKKRTGSWKSRLDTSLKSSDI